MYTGLPPSILQGSQATPDDLFQVTRAVNAKGGPLKGFEINYQQPFTFLPGFLSKLGTLLNYVYVSSEVDYVVGANAEQTVTTDLAGLSKHSANGTIASALAARSDASPDCRDQTAGALIAIALLTTWVISVQSSRAVLPW